MVGRLLPGLLVALLCAGCVSVVEGRPVAGPRPPVTTTGCQFPRDADTVAPKRVAPPDERDVPVEGKTVLVARIEKGELELTLDAASAPCSAHSFRHLAELRFFDGGVCHRLRTAELWFLQCGDPTGKGTGGPGYKFADPMAQVGRYPRGTIGVANRGEGTNGSQFFIVYEDSPIPPEYPVVGRVTRGMEVVDEIASLGVAPTYTPDRKVVVQTDGKPLLEVNVSSIKVK